MPVVSQQNYAERLSRYCVLLANGQVDEMLPAIVASSANDVERYLQNGWGERYEILTKELALVGLAFADFPSLIDRYLCSVPKANREPHGTDQQRCLHWLKRTLLLTPQQRDFIQYQQAEYACLKRARAHRALHVAFQRSLAGSTTSSNDKPATRWHLNPVRAWSWLNLPAGDEFVSGPCDVVFFPIGDEVRSLSCSGRERSWLTDLPRQWSGTLDEWALQTGNPPGAELRASLFRWAEVGLVVAE
jgi:hypothetical protein